MKEITTEQIAAALAGYPGSAWSELRLLMLFDSNPDQRIDAPEAARRSLPKAA